MIKKLFVSFFYISVDRGYIKISKITGMEFDVTICDEAHRTTGVTLAGDDESNFVKVHDNNIIYSKKRLYMTATPRIYADESKKGS